MILGIGNDIIDIRRIERTLERHGDRFIARVFTAVEQARSERRLNRAASTPSALPPRKPAPRRWARVSAAASS